MTSAAVNGYLNRIVTNRPHHSVGVARPTVPFGEFRQLVRRIRPSVLLPALAALTLAEFTGPYADWMRFTAPPWAVAAAARESILWGNEHRGDTIDPEYLRRLFNTYSNISEPKPDPGDGVDALAMLTRLAYDQFPYSESIFEEVSRTHALMVEGAETLDLEVLNEPDAWVRMVGAPVGQAVGATFLLQTAANVNAGWYDQRWLDRPDLQPLYDLWPRAVIEQRAADLTHTVGTFKADYESKPSVGDERFGYNPLTARPFLCMPDGRSLAPQPRLILRTVTPGSLYYRGMDIYGEAFGRDLGKMTERYVGQLLTNIAPTPEVHPEVRYGKGNGQASTDWFLVLPSAVVMFEVKSSRYGLRERAAVPGYESRITTLLSKALGQLAVTSERLDDGHQRFAHVPSDRPRVGIIVTAEPYYLANSGWMRDRLKPTPFPTLIASLRDLERLTALPLDQVESQLLAIANDPERSTWNLANSLQGIPVGPNPVLQRAWDIYPWPGEPTSHPPAT